MRPVVLIQGGCNQVWHCGNIVVLVAEGRQSERAAVNPGLWAGSGPNTSWISLTYLISSCSENRWFFPLPPALLWHQDGLFSTYAWSVFAMVPRTHSVFCFFSTCLLRWKSGMIHEISATPPCELGSYGFFTSISSHILSHSRRTSRAGRATGIPQRDALRMCLKTCAGEQKGGSRHGKEPNYGVCKVIIVRMRFSCSSFSSVTVQKAACATNCFGKSGTLKDHENIGFIIWW